MNKIRLSYSKYKPEFVECEDNKFVLILKFVISIVYLKSNISQSKNQKMKHSLLLTFLSLCLSFQLVAQNKVVLNINHKLGDSDFAFGQAAKNNLEHDFDVARLEYYISEISLINGDEEILIEDLYILANAKSTTEVELGEYDLSTVEKIRLHIGVDEEHNHLDPAEWHSSHPLAPKSPSMHWGWTSGYRFVAMEGTAGENLKYDYQLHGLGDVNYFATEIEVNASAQNNILSVNLDADYTKALENIAVEFGVNVHGDKNEAKIILENFRDYVFSASPNTSSTIDFSEVKTFHVFPNPVTNYTTTINLQLENHASQYDLTISTIDGKEIQYITDIKDNQKVSFINQNAGIYFLSLIKEGQVILTRKVVLNE